MSMTDTLADMLTRIRNGHSAKLFTVTALYSGLCENVLEVLKTEGYIRDYQKIANDNNHTELKIELKYLEGLPVIKEISRVSKPGRRQYTKISRLPKFYNGLGISILSTSHGVMSDYEARQKNIGGEVLCTVF